MRIRNLRTAIFCLALSMLYGCVTEQSYVDSKQQVRTLAFDKEDAAKSRLLLGLGYLRNNNYPQAKFNLEKALEYAPTRADVHYSLAYYYQTVGDVEQAELSYQYAIKIEPKNPDTLNNYGVFLCELAEHQQALVYFKLAVAIPTYSQVAQSYENMAMCTLEAGQYTDALNYLTLSYKHAPNRIGTLVELVALHYAMGDMVKASDYYQMYNSHNQHTASGLLLGVLLEIHLGRSERAAQYQSLLLETFPLSREALLVGANLIDESVYEKRRLRYLNLNKTVSSANVKPAGAVSDSFEQPTNLQPDVYIAPMETVPESVHSVVGIGSNNSIPDEIIISQQDSDPAMEIIERVPTLEINVEDVEIPRYTVQYGENLYRVSVKFNIQIATLVKWNKLQKQQINAGDKLFVQNPDVFYTVKQSKYLSILADELNIPLNKLMDWNNVTQDGLVTAGTKILKVELEKL